MAEFKIHRCLGRGGFGEVYRGVMSRGGGIAMDVAIKVLRPDLDPSSQGVQRLRDEGRLLGRLTHPTILRVYDLVVIEGRAALISEFVDGDDLARVVKTDARPGPRAVFEIVAQVAAALDAAWSWPSVTDGQPLHLVHRDIKPDNIRLDHHGVVKLLDFGIAQASAIEREAETSVNIIMGSAQYLAPERMVQQEVGPESDVFALGCTLYEALMGEALFHRKSMRQMYLLMVEADRYEPFLHERLQKLDGVLDHDRGRALLRSMLAYAKGDRPTAGEVASRCDAICEGLGGMTLRRWARTHDWPGTETEEHGPLEGRAFTSVLSLPAPEARTLALHTDDREPPDPADSLTDPGFRQPVLGELTAEPAEVLPAESEASPWSGAELVALRQVDPPPRAPDDDDGDGPTVQVRLPAEFTDSGQKLPSPPSPPADPPSPPVADPRPRPTHRPDVHATYPVFDFDEDTVGMKIEPREVTPPPHPAEASDPLERSGPDLELTDEVDLPRPPPPVPVDPPAAEDTGPTDEKLAAAAQAVPADDDFHVQVDDDAPSGDATPEPEPEPEPEEADEPAVDDDDYVPQPGDIDLSDTFGTQGVDVNLRVAPPGATLTSRAPAPVVPAKRKPPASNRASVMVLSGTLGVFVGAVVIGGIAFFMWLIVG